MGLAFPHPPTPHLTSPPRPAQKRELFPSCPTERPTTNRRSQSVSPVIQRPSSPNVKI
ncbi:hypothetical protein AAFF_G00360050 [Aldrovandia affinis]|uniref:Uncharacterized protein n=1 Tax=Aldrovandia affinis TaxID=143900 RepID=A0AAD7SIC6_9TELE|nr:hypothetical protein AAFF_G00360050 [Aldrovandia affinis]